ncbi:MFS general substrate transporter [Sodiomyces alkalinus F11]|uniref:MFS general substrate transporter n=1 Tax=Sodiomyces alkalinus (strain CBS 110278 / VKM F-3762 / F11) TaxID=1314773 RepID=A0A3N2PJ28_SODAK|nr:MFS general substrate transporter [Sodiomyces alkalinus F11]ROT34440.1 MFS general substrate transporter [Sodiomyces alkalinus F11]
MAAATSTTTAIRLETIPPSSVVTQRDVIQETTNPRDTGTDPDPVLAASRAADSTVPDGGYGWVVVSCCSLVTWWFVGTSYSWGVIQGALVADGVGSPGTLAFVGSLSAALISALAIVNARVVRWIGTRYTGLLGIFLIGLAEITASFAVSNVGGLFATVGVLLGLGMSLCFMTVSVAPAQYFNRKRGLANGIVFAGGGLGGALNSLVLDSLIQKYGPAWTYRVLGLATLVTGLPAAWMIKERTPIRTTALVEWRLFRDPGFLLVFAAGAVGTFPLFVPPFFVPLYSRSMGLSSTTGAGLLAGFNFSSAVGRILCGFFCDRLGPLNTLLASFLLTAVSMLALWPVSTTLAPLAVFVVVNGASNGGFFSTMPTVVGNTFGSARVSVAMGMVVTGWGGGYLMGAPIAGYLLDAYGGAEEGLHAYRPAMFYAGSLALAGAGLVAFLKFRTNKNIFAKV